MSVMIAVNQIAPVWTARLRMAIITSLRRTRLPRQDHVEVQFESYDLGSQARTSSKYACRR